MFAITIAFGAQSWRLLYKTQERAEAHFAEFEQPADKTTQFSASTHKVFIDDFGQRAVLKMDAVIGAMFENLEESKLGTIEMGLHQQRTQMSFQQRAESDPTIRSAAAMRGPAVLTPMGGNGRGFS